MSYEITREKAARLTQATPEWLMARCGRVTASRVADLMAKTKKGYSASRHRYLMEIVVEIVTGRATETYVSPAMEWGIEQEPFARAAYECQQDVNVDTVGLVFHPSLERFAASPDGLLGSDGLVEFKCPNSVTHLEYIEEGCVPEEYIPQINAQLSCTGRQWCDFVSFDPRLPHGLQLFIRRHERDRERITEMELEVEKFLGELAEALDRIASSKPLVGTLVKMMPIPTDEEIPY
jgi:putative phage-type endonuclease